MQQCEPCGSDCAAAFADDLVPQCAYCGQVVGARERNASLTKDLQSLELQKQDLLMKLFVKVLHITYFCVHAMAWTAHFPLTRHDISQILTVCAAVLTSQIDQFFTF